MEISTTSVTFVSHNQKFWFPPINNCSNKLILCIFTLFLLFIHIFEGVFKGNSFPKYECKLPRSRWLATFHAEIRVTFETLEWKFIPHTKRSSRWKVNIYAKHIDCRAYGL